MRVIGNLQVNGEKSLIKLSSDFLLDKEYSGHYVEEEVGENVTFGKPLYFDFDNIDWRISDNSSLTKLACKGIALEDKNAGEICRILRLGTLRNDAWNFTSNVLYVSSSGDITTTLPTSTGSFVQAIGSAIGVNVAFFDFNTTLIENV